MEVVGRLRVSGVRSPRRPTRAIGCESARNSTRGKDGHHRERVESPPPALGLTVPRREPDPHPRARGASRRRTRARPPPRTRSEFSGTACPANAGPDKGTLTTMRAIIYCRVPTKEQTENLSIPTPRKGRRALPFDGRELEPPQPAWPSVVYGNLRASGTVWRPHRDSNPGFSLERAAS